MKGPSYPNKQFKDAPQKGPKVAPIAADNSIIVDALFNYISLQDLIIIDSAILELLRYNIDIIQVGQVKALAIP